MNTLVNTIKVGVVVIGRNEGQRLINCFNALKNTDVDLTQVVYVDSGSSDGSQKVAEDLGAVCVDLDMSIPFSAARARNEGWRYLNTHFEDISYVQFIDGDCLLQPNWLEAAISFLDEHPKVAAVCGRRRETHPSASLYNRFCDDEWNTPVGDALACGGDALIRLEALLDVNGYTNHFVAGEEPEMCYRMRKKGWTIHRINSEMTLHDAAIFKFSQWWNRSKRAGFAFALTADTHGHEEEKIGVKHVQRALFWSALPLACVILSFVHPVLIITFLIFPAQIIRVALNFQPFGKYALKKSGYLLLAKLAETSGVISFYKKKWRKDAFQIIEYK